MQNKREFLSGIALGLAAGAAAPALAQGMKMQGMKMKGPAPNDAPRGKSLPNRMAKTTKLYKAPGIWPNALATSTEGLWIAQQHLTEGEAKGAGAPYPNKGKEQAWLVDANGKVLKTCESDAVNTSGLAYGDGQLWVMSNTEDEPTGGVHQVDVTANKEVAHRQIPLSPNNISGGIHGAKWKDGKLWIVNIRMHSLIRVNPKTWLPEAQFPIYAPPGMARFHDITFDKDGSLLQVIASEKSTSHADNVAGLVRLDPVTGKPLETITFVPGSCDPHGLELHNGQLISVDAGYHPGWANYDSPSSQWVFRIDMV